MEGDTSIAVFEQTERLPVPTNVDIERAEAEFVNKPHISEAEGKEGVFLIDCPLKHHFCPGVYIREIFMPEGALIIGHEHLTEHFNIILSGTARVTVGSAVQEIVGPCMITSGPGVRKTLYILKDMIWQTVHANPDNCTDIAVLEDRIRVKSKTFLESAEQLRLLQHQPPSLCQSSQSPQ